MFFHTTSRSCRRFGRRSLPDSLFSVSLSCSEDYRRLGCHIVPTNGKSQLIQPLVIAKHFGIPTYVVFDADADKPDRSGSRVKHEKDTTERYFLFWGHQTNALCPTTQFGARDSQCGIPILDRSSNPILEEEWTTFRQKADTALWASWQAWEERASYWRVTGLCMGGGQAFRQLGATV